MNSTNKTLSVAAIKHGTVIDHITAGYALRIIRLLDLAANKSQVTVGLNLPSKQLRYKDIIKVEGHELTPEEVNQIAVFSPKATINIIHDFKVKKKFTVHIPEVIEYIIICPNTRCVTNHERMKTRFWVTSTSQMVQLRCAYCSKQFSEDDIVAYNS